MAPPAGISPEDERRIREDQKTRDSVAELSANVDKLLGLVAEVQRHGRMLADLWQWRQDVEEAFGTKNMSADQKAAAGRMSAAFLKGEHRRSTWWRRPEIIIPSITGLLIAWLSGTIHLPRVPWP